MRRALALFGLAIACGGASSLPASTASTSPTASHVAVRHVEEEELVIPFYEGVRVPWRDAPMLELPYPGVLATPMIIFGAGDEWTAIYAPLDALGLVFRMRDGRIELSCPRACKFETVRGSSWEGVAHAVAKAYDVHGQPPLATRFTSQHFYVRDWISTEGEPRRTAWTRDGLRARLEREPPDALQHVYGIDPGGVDLGATYFREPTARAEAEAMIREHPKLSFFSWLNLRTYKWDTHGCTSPHHLHRPANLEDESRITRDFVKKLSDYARAHGVLLSEEEPSAAFLPFVSGYVDRIANPPTMYEIWQKVPSATVVPLFSTMFGAVATPYTDPSPTKPVPSGWITTTKIESP